MKYRPGPSRRSENWQAGNSSKRPRILCVDDDPNVSAAIERQLRPFSIDVLHAYSGIQGYWQLATESPDAVIVDLGMPNGSGSEMIEWMRHNQATRHIPVIVLTGKVEQFSRRRLFDLGISAFLRKPVDRERLLLELNQCLRPFLNTGDYCHETHRTICR